MDKTTSRRRGWILERCEESRERAADHLMGHKGKNAGRMMTEVCQEEAVRPRPLKRHPEPKSEREKRRLGCRLEEEENVYPPVCSRSVVAAAIAESCMRPRPGASYSWGKEMEDKEKLIIN